MRIHPSIHPSIHHPYPRVASDQSAIDPAHPVTAGQTGVQRGAAPVLLIPRRRCYALCLATLEHGVEFVSSPIHRSVAAPVKGLRKAHTS